MKIGFRMWILIILLVLSVIAIGPNLSKGFVITDVSQDSELYQAGLRSGDDIISVNGIAIDSTATYANVLNDINDNTTRRIDVVTSGGDYTLFTNETVDFSIQEKQFTNIKTGLDLRGGARALVKPDVEVNKSEMDDLVAISKSRFDAFGIRDVQVQGVSDLEGNRFMLIEIAGATPDDLENLIAQQGKFSAKIGNTSVFTSDSGDIASVGRGGQEAGIRSCQEDGAGGYYCNFAFTIFLTNEAAERHADITSELGLDETGRYLDEKLYLYVDDNEVDSLLIGASLRGQATTQISIQGSGTGTNLEDARDAAIKDMKQLQTILITGSLPYKLEIVKLDTISPTLGHDFTNTILLAGVFAILVVSLIVFAKYRSFKSTLALLFTSFSELVLILGFAALVGWNLDLPSIAGILATIGTGVDQQIVILDESRKRKDVGIKERMKNALFVITTAYLTSVVALLPLWWAGAGLFKGFAFTTIIGITSGVLITRPAFAEMIRKIEGD